MYVDFNLLPQDARLWIYQANRKFSTDEEKLIRAEAHSFCEQWAAHGSPLKTSFAIENSQFLILAVDQDFNGASGCSIDGSIHMLKSLQDRTQIDFFDRSRAAFLVRDEVRLIPLDQLKEAFASGTLGPATLTFNLLATSKAAWESNWIIAAERTWLARYLPKNSVA